MKSISFRTPTVASLKKQGGYSLVELAIALAILSVVIIGALVGVQRILDNNRANNILRQIPMTNASLIATTTSTGGNFSGMNTSIVGRLGSFQDGTVAANGQAANPFGGVYWGSPQTAAIGNQVISSGYFITVNRIPNSMCATVANGVSALARGVWVIPADVGAEPAQADITVAANRVKDPATLGSQINLAVLSTACGNTGATTKAVAMYFTR